MEIKRRVTVKDLVESDDHDLEVEVFIMMLTFDIDQVMVENWDYSTFMSNLGQAFASHAPIEGGIWRLSDGREIPVATPTGIQIYRAAKNRRGLADGDVALACAVTGMARSQIEALPLGDFMAMRDFLIPFALYRTPTASELA